MDVSVLNDDFYEGRRSESLPFVLNDEVKIRAGLHSGKVAVVIAIQSSATELTYLVEHGDGSGDSVVKATELVQLT